MARILNPLSSFLALSLSVFVPQVFAEDPPQYLMEWGSLGSGNGEFDNPSDIAVGDDGNLYVVDTGNNRVQRFTSSGVYLSQWGSPGTEDGQFSNIRGITVDAVGDVYVTGNDRIQKFDQDGNFILKWGSNCRLAYPSGCIGEGDGQFYVPVGIAVDSERKVYVSDNGNGRIQKFSESGDFLAKWDLFIPVSPGWMASGVGNELFVTYDDEVIQYSSAGDILGSWKSPRYGQGKRIKYGGIATDSDGNVYVSDWENHIIEKYDRNHVFLTSWGSYGSDPGLFENPRGLAVNDDGSIYVVDSVNNRIQKFTSQVTSVVPASWGYIKSRYPE